MRCSMSAHSSEILSFCASSACGNRCWHVLSRRARYTVMPRMIPSRLAGHVGNRQGALIGDKCLTQGQAKCTYGTGAFLPFSTGTDIVYSNHGLLSMARDCGSGSVGIDTASQEGPLELVPPPMAGFPTPVGKGERHTIALGHHGPNKTN